MNFNFLSGQQQMSGQQPGMLQSLPRQQFAFNDAQLLPQQVMLKQMHELQRQKHYQQLDAMQRNVVGQIPAFPNQMVGHHSLASNGNPMYDASNYPWPSQAMDGDTNWSHRGPSFPIQGYSNGVMITPEQGHAMRFMELTQQTSQQSFYGIPVSSTSNVNALSPEVPPVSAPSNSFSINSQYAPFSEQVHVQDETIASRLGSEGKHSFAHGYSQGLSNVVGFGSFNQMQKTNVPISERVRQNSAGSSEMLPEKFVNPSTTKQDVVALDPTEEKILFGSDENIWEAFGSDINGLDGPDMSNGLPLLQSGTWSALMQSAVAETTSTDAGMQEEWSGFGYPNSSSQSSNLQSSVVEDNAKEQPIWVDKSQKNLLDLQNTLGNVNKSSLQQQYLNHPFTAKDKTMQGERKGLDANQHMPQTRKNWPFVNDNPSQDLPRIDTGFWSNRQRNVLHDDSDQSSGDQRNLHVGIEKPSEQTGRVPVTRKFKYHPMGDLDMDVDSCSYASNQTMCLQPKPHHLSSGVRGHETPTRFLGQSNTNSKHLEACVIQGAPHISDGVDNRPGQYPNTSMSTKTGLPSSQHQNLSPSQNMLELLHKVDQSKEQTSVTHTSSTDGNFLPEMASGGSARLGQSQSTTSNVFSLQLAPPCQGAAPSNLNIATQNSSRTVDSTTTGITSFETENKGHALLVSVSSAQYSPSPHTSSQLDPVNEKSGISGSVDDRALQNLKGNPSTPLGSGSYLRSPLQHDHKVAGGEKMIVEQSSLPFVRHNYLNHQINDSQDQATPRQSVSNSLKSLASGRGMNRLGSRASMHQMPVSSLGIVPCMPRNDNVSPSGAKMWLQQQQLTGVQACNAAEVFQSQFQSNDAVSSQGVGVRAEPMVAEGQPIGKKGNVYEEKEPVTKHQLNASPSYSAANENDIETFHHSSKLNNIAQHGYPLLHQTQIMKSMVADPSYHESKRLKETNNAPDAQGISGKAEKTQQSISGPSKGQISKDFGDAKILNIPQPDHKMSSMHSAHGMCTTQETLSCDPTEPPKVDTGNVTIRADHGGISPQMAPSCLQHYETFRNGGQSLSVHNIPRLPGVKNADQQFLSGKTPSCVDGCDSVQPVNVTSGFDKIANDVQTKKCEHVLSLDALVPRVYNPTSASMKSKKRKTVTSDLMSWSKEIEQGFMSLQNISSAEVDWAKSSNRFVEKVHDEIDANEDMLRTSRPKRRLTLTTQLMQLVFPSPSPAVLSVSASSYHEMIVYTVARLTAGAACSLACYLESDSPLNLGSENRVLGKVKSSKTRRDQYFSRIIEDFINRAKELENELSRLDKRASILDFRLDLQDLERFSIINRFAKFHNRVQVDGTVSSSSCSDPNDIIQRPCPQRYVSAHPMPRNIPDGVHCLLL